jgi:hypothetical protein
MDHKDQDRLIKDCDSIIARVTQIKDISAKLSFDDGSLEADRARLRILSQVAYMIDVQTDFETNEALNALRMVKGAANV